MTRMALEGEESLWSWTLKEFSLLKRSEFSIVIYMHGLFNSLAAVSAEMVCHKEHPVAQAQV